jgi:hypothetical protein
MKTNKGDFKVAEWLYSLHESRAMGAVTGGPTLSDQELDEAKKLVEYGHDRGWPSASPEEMTAINNEFVELGNDPVTPTKNMGAYREYINKKLAELN